MYANGKIVIDVNEYRDMLSYLLDLNRGPYSYGAADVTEKAVNSLAGFLSGMSVIPTVDGGVQLEVHSTGFDIEIEFTKNGDICNIAVGKYNFVSSNCDLNTAVRHRNGNEDIEILSDADGNFGSFDLWINNHKEK